MPITKDPANRDYAIYDGKHRINHLGDYVYDCTPARYDADGDAFIIGNAFQVRRYTMTHMDGTSTVRWKLQVLCRDGDMYMVEGLHKTRKDALVWALRNPFYMQCD
tara:strand:- start:188 stop:505 length:318 start_codon:yes stop_codon:yes gene_type:complete